MKTWLSVVLAMIVGVGAGVGAAIVEINLSTAKPALSANEVRKNQPGEPPKMVANAPQPKVVVDNDSYDFGAMDSSAEGSHDFVLSNTGNAPLTLSEGGTTCKCTVANLEKEELPPGESAKVTLNWTAGHYLGEFQQTATILTNDPQRSRVTLSVAGRITTVLQAIPQEVVFSRLSAGQSASAEVHLYCYTSDRLEIGGSEFSDPETAQFFQVGYEPLLADQLDEEAQSGYLVRLTVKPGLPQGLFRQTIRLATNLPSASTIEIPVEGTIGSDISVLGRGWNEKVSVLTLGIIRTGEEAKRTLSLVARGPYRKEVRFKPVEVFPEMLQVDVGQTTPINNGVAMQTPVTIRVPQMDRPVNHWGSKQGKMGRVILQTNHPQVPQLKILVKFLVEGG